jgi:poly-gamma-glutamate synthesis protein (capsule biosynthesis protein)
MQSAEGYVQLAERANGVIPRAVTLSYIWGAALEELDRLRPDVRIVNLETSITRGGRFAPKGINYRMSPKNAACLTAADLDCCVLANNHILDFDKTGLLDSLEILERLKVKFVGAGRNRTQADLPAVLDIQGGGRVLVFAVGAYSSGIPPSWSATDTAPGVRFIKDLSDETAAEIADDIIRQRKSGDLAILSVHWGSNWGFEIPDAHRRFAHRLIDSAPVSIVHGHSSHHPIAVEVYRNRLILYGCGDLLNDYEGIAGHEQFLNSLSLMYFVTVQRATGDLAEVVIVPLRIRRFQLVHASRQDVDSCQRRSIGNAAGSAPV